MSVFSRPLRILLGLFLLPVLTTGCPTQRWAMSYGGLEGRAVVSTDDGGYLFVGSAFAPDMQSTDVYLVKTNAAGVQSWSKRIGGSASERAFDAERTADGGYIIVGRSSEGSLEPNDMLVIKTDSAGTAEWTSGISFANHAVADAVIQTGDGGYVIAGSTLNGAVNSDGVLIKLDPNGLQEWSEIFPGTPSIVFNDIKVTSDNGFIITGFSITGRDEFSDVHLLKTDATGDEEWRRTYGGPEQDIGFAVIQASDGGYVVAGRFQNTTQNNVNAYLVKTDINGVRQWSSVYNASRSSSANSVVETGGGGFAMAGYITNSSGSDHDMYVAKADANGAQEWQREYGDSDDDEAYDLAAAMNGGFIVVGQLSDPVTVDRDMYALKLDGNGRLNIPIYVPLP